MRISDWSSDVCSSDLLEKPSRVERVDLSGAVREVTAYEYDGLGRCIRQTASDGAVTCYTYDLAGRVLNTILPDGTVIGKSYAAQSQGDRKSTRLNSSH